MTGDQEGLAPPGFVAAGQPIEIACDESGSEGENLVGGNTDVFAHASVHLDTAWAADSVQEIRNRIRSPATEYKANHLLREKHRPVLEWLLGPSGPIYGHARVQLIDKTFFAVGRVADLLVGETAPAVGAGPGQDPRAGAMALTLYREGPETFGRERWQAFLEAANNLMRTRNRWGLRAPVDAFFHMVGVLRLDGPGNPVDEVLELFQRTRPRADSFRVRLLADPAMIPALDPLIPAIVQTVLHWSADERPVSIVHDEQNSLTGERVAQLREILGGPPAAALHRAPPGRLAGLRLVDSRYDPRVQLADFLAGVARKIASEELNARGDPDLTALLRPYVNPSSIWGDDRSWSLLEPTTTAPS
ncbi:DUF3800 domain-containing protein [Sphaerisporangium corydalis]|uniref:DUF3800 domain-containing protein n=1 Tax=Sphaerisporangium corydalis TaxID=1441875 RepID=A0ABV9EJW0_9ACTN|nr:DUF3800 domain-containing protein [Sphaerisporangium corydalis]